jgi:hypothetical protein
MATLVTGQWPDFLRDGYNEDDKLSKKK